MCLKKKLVIDYIVFYFFLCMINRFFLIIDINVFILYVRMNLILINKLRLFIELKYLSYKNCDCKF